MDNVETTFRAAGESYRRAEQHLMEAETSLRKLLARFLVAEMAKPAPEEAAEPVRHDKPEIWDRVDQLLATRRPRPVEKPEPVTP